MCGKFIQAAGWGGTVTLAELIGASTSPSETVTPMRFATVIRVGASGAREAVRLRWGLTPPGSRDPGRAPFIHARAESIDERPTFRDAFLRRRGLVAVKSFNEGKEIGPRKTEQHVIAPKDGTPLAIAVIWERWGEKHGAALESFAMVTVAANPLIASITDRMPAVVAPGDWAKWLGEEPASAAELKAMLVPRSGDWTMQAERTAPPGAAYEESQPTLF